MTEHKNKTDANPCPWCHKDARVYLNGSYVEGWTSFVECSDYLCNARGPQKQSGPMSNDDYVTQDRAIESWNMVATVDNSDD